MNSRVFRIVLFLVVAALGGGPAARAGAAGPELHPDAWRTVGRGTVEYGDARVTIDDALLASRIETSSRFSLSFRARTPTGQDQVQVWSGFGFRGRDQRYALGLRGGNHDDLYLYRRSPGAGSRMLALEPLDLSPRPGEWVCLRVVFVEGTIRVFLNDETLPRILVTDEVPIPSGAVVLGGGWIPAEFRDVEIRDLSAEEVAALPARTVRERDRETPAAREQRRQRDRAAWKPRRVETLGAARTEVSLDGDWLFRPESELPATGAPWAGDLDDGDWHVMRVPAFWNPARNWLHLQDSDLPHGGSGASDNYRERENRRCASYTFDATRTTAAWYRQRIFLPESIRGRHVRLHFDAVSKVADVYVNGAWVGGHVGMFGEFSLDVSKHIRPGENVVAVSVRARKFEKTAGADRNVARAVSVNITSDMLNSLPCGMFRGDEGGIWQPVKLVVTASVHVEDVHAMTRTDGATIDLALRNSGDADGTAAVAIEIRDSESGTVLYATPEPRPVAVPAGGLAKLRLDTGPLEPRLWSPEEPNLYTLRCTMTEAGRRVDSVEKTIGFRTFRAVGGRFELNGRPYYVRGANHPPCGIAPNDRGLADRFLGLMHDGNQMVTRSHGCPFTKTWMDAADRQGVGVSYEGSWPWMMISNVPSKELLEIWRKEMLSLVRKYRSHPSLLIWTVNNEMYFPMFHHDAPPEVRREKMTFLSDVVKEIRALSPGTPISCDSGYSRVAADYEKNLAPHGIDDGDIDDRHVYFNWYNRDFFQVFNGEWARRIYWSPGANPGRPFFSQEASTGYPNNDSGHYNRKYLFKNCVPQAWMGDHAYEDRDPAVTLDRHAFLTKELAEVIRRTSPETAGVLLFANVCWFRNAFEADRIEPWPVYEAVKLAHQPVLVSAELFGRRAWAGATLSPRVCLVNDALDGQKLGAGTLSWTIEHDGRVLAKGRRTTPVVPHGERVWVDLSVTLPERLPVPKAACQLRLRYRSAGEERSRNEYDLLLAMKEWGRARPLPAGTDIGVFDPTGDTIRVLDFLGVPHVRLADLTEIRTRDLDVLVVANLDTEEEVPYNWEDVRTMAKRGLEVLLVHPGKHLQWLFYDRIASIYERRGRVVNMRIPEHPAFEGIDPMELAWWHAPGRQRPRACRRSFRLKNRDSAERLCTYLRPHTGLPGDREETFREMSGTPLLQIREGEGIVVASEMEVNQGTVDPVAARLFSNLLHWLATGSRR